MSLNVTRMQERYGIVEYLQMKWDTA